MWRHHCPELIESVDPAMLFDEGGFPAHHIVKYTEIESSRTLATTLVIGEMNFALPNIPSKVPIVPSSGYCLASHLAGSSPSLVSIISLMYHR